MHATTKLITLVTLFASVHWTRAIDTHLNDKMTECITRAKDCTKTDAGSTGVICGSDDHTYPNQCALLLAQCYNNGVTYKAEGQCKDPQPCLESLRYAKDLQNAGIKGVFTPKCRRDGRYASIQCSYNEESGQEEMQGVDHHCWCVTPSGLPVAGTAIRTGRPKCGRHRRKSGRRRSSNVNKRYSDGKGKNKKNKCQRADRLQFNANVVRIFKSEWLRSLKSDKTDTDTSSTDQMSLEWKFGLLDANRNGQLEAIEFRELKKLVRKFLEPKRCARMFTKTCDLNRDKILSRDEWVDCLSENEASDPEQSRFDEKEERPKVNNYDPPFNYNPIPIDAPNSMPDEDYDDPFKNILSFDDLRHMHPGSILQSSSRDVFAEAGDAFDEMYTSSDNSGQNDSNIDCLSDRKAVLNEQQSSTLFVPECSHDGRYKKVQCYTNYCWCVFEDTGKTIPGTTIKNSEPNCESMDSNVNTRPMKGCSEAKKMKFMTDLIDYFHIKIGDSKFHSRADKDWWAQVERTLSSREQKAAEWSLHELDTNKNQILERNEWKAFRTMVTTVKELRHCGKKLPRYCDVNGDKKITKTEWFGCLGVVQKMPDSASQTDVATAVKSGRTGPNPLEVLLKSD